LNCAEKELILIKSIVECYEINKSNAEHHTKQTDILSVLTKRKSLFSQQVLFEIVKSVASRNGGEVSEHIQDFGLDPDRRFEIAKIAAAQGGLGVSKHIQNYGLESDRRFAIAKIAAAQSGWAVSEHIQNYGLESDRRFEIAKIAAAKSGGGVSTYIQNYDLESDCRFEIAKISAAESGGGISRHIQNYALESDRRFEIAKIAAAQHGWVVSECIHNYSLELDRRFEIAKIAASESGRGVSECIQNYGLEEPRKLLAIFLIAFNQNPETLAHFAKYRFPDDEPLCKVFDLFAQENSDVSAVATAIQAFAERQKWKIQSSLEEMIKLKNTKVQKELLIWLSHFLGSCLLEDLSSDQFHFLSQENFIQSAISLRDPAFRYTLTRAMLQLAKDATAQKFVAEYLKLPFYKSKIEPYKRLPLLLISSLYVQGGKISKETCQMLVTISGNKRFQDLGHLRDLLKGLHAVIQTDALTSQDKGYLLSVIIDKSRFPQKEGGRPVKKTQETDIFKLLKNLGTVNAVIALKATHSLKREALIAKGSDLSVALQEIFQSHLPIKAISDFGEHYQRCFGNARIPHYILQYIAVIERSPENEKERLMSTLVSCVEGILEGNLESLRYDMDQSLHLKTIFSTREDLFEAWKKGAAHPLSDFLAAGFSSKRGKSYEGFTIMDMDDAQDLFLCGTEVPESCLRISGEQILSKCLMGYVLDGKNRIIEVKDPSGKIIARHILRILWDEAQQQPVLFLERLYPAIVAPEIQKALLSFAKSRAKALGLSLLSQGYSKEISYASPVRSLGSRAPFEYTDTGAKIIADGGFQITVYNSLPVE
jgi:hypothetical protein